MEGYCSTGQSPHRAVAPLEEEDDVRTERLNGFAIDCLHILRDSIENTVKNFASCRKGINRSIKHIA